MNKNTTQIITPKYFSTSVVINNRHFLVVYPQFQASYPQVMHKNTRHLTLYLCAILATNHYI